MAARHDQRSLLRSIPDLLGSVDIRLLTRALEDYQWNLGSILELFLRDLRDRFRRLLPVCINGTQLNNPD